jgi:hypothetical protein
MAAKTEEFNEQKSTFFAASGLPNKALFASASAVKLLSHTPAVATATQ